MKSDSTDYIELLHKTVTTVQWQELEDQVSQLTELVQSIHDNKEVVEVVTRHLATNMNNRTVRMAMLLTATYEALVNSEINEENVNKIALALKKSMSVLNQELK